MSVSDVRVIDTPTRPIARPTRSGMSTASSVESKALVMTKASSIPIPTRMKGKICARMVNGTESNMALPKPPTQATSTSSRSQKPQLRGFYGI